MKVYVALDFFDEDGAYTLIDVFDSLEAAQGGINADEEKVFQTERTLPLEWFKEPEDQDEIEIQGYCEPRWYTDLVNGHSHVVIEKEVRSAP